jgi:hypothetical protein
LLKGAGVEAIWPHMLALVGFAVALVGVSAWRFRKQLDDLRRAHPPSNCVRRTLSEYAALTVVP